MINGTAARKLAQTATTAGARYVDSIASFLCDGRKMMKATIGERASNAMRYQPSIALHTISRWWS